MKVEGNYLRAFFARNFVQAKFFFLVLMLLVSSVMKGQEQLPDSSVVVFMDSKIMETQEAYWKVHRGEATGIGEVISVRNAIMNFGERARNGIWTFWTINKPEEAPLQPDEYVIHGTINPAYNGELAMLFTFKPTDWEKIQHVDTVMVADGKFSFRGKVNDYNPSILAVGNYPKPTRSVELFLDAGNIQVSLDSLSVVGSPLNDALSQFQKTMKRFTNDITQVKSDSLKRMLSLSRKSIYKEFIKQNIHNGIGRMYCYGWNYSLPDFEELYALTDDTLKNTPWMLAVVEEHKRDQERMKKLSQMSGETFKNHSFETLSKKRKELKSYVGKSKLLVVDVWASWCGPCKREIPHLKKVYDAYKDKGLSIISVSIDDSDKKWKEAVDKFEMPWEQLRTGSDEDMKSFMADYLIEGIPHMIIIDKEGIIVYAGSALRAEQGQLQELLDEKLK